MIKFTKFDVRSFDLDHLDLFWEIEDTVENIDRHAFHVLKSVDGPGGPFRQIAGPFSNTYFLRDPEVNLLHNWRQYFYKIKVIHKDTGKEVEIGPVALGADPDLVTLELRRRFELMLQEFNGRRTLVFPAITFGFRCPHCFDRSTSKSGRSIGRQTTQNCATCYDMSFAGGFAQPLISYIQFDPAPKTVQRTDTTERSQQETTARLSAFPPLKPKDIIVEAENLRWQVERVSSTSKLRAVVHQEIALHRIPKSDIRYRVPINTSLLDAPGPVREFTRPMDLQSPEETPLSDMLDGLLGGP